MAYGTPRSPDDIEPYYTDIRRGRPPTAEQLADLVGRYEAIGGVSPLARAHGGAARRPPAGARSCWRPTRTRWRSVSSTPTRRSRRRSSELAGQGIEQIVAVVMAPHYSAGSVGQYLERTRAAAGPHGIDVVAIESWATEPAFVDFLAADVRRRLAAMPSNTKTLFTAHSLPTRIIAGGDPYPDELNATADAVASAAGLGEWSQWAIAWQSAGRTPEPWIGPDILAVIDDLADVGGRRRGARLRVRLRRRSPRGALRPRHRSSPAGRIARPRVRPHGLRQRRSGG